MTGLGGHWVRAGSVLCNGSCSAVKWNRGAAASPGNRVWKPSSSEGDRSLLSPGPFLCPMPGDCKRQKLSVCPDHKYVARHVFVSNSQEAAVSWLCVLGGLASMHSMSGWMKLFAHHVPSCIQGKLWPVMGRGAK